MLIIPTEKRFDWQHAPIVLSIIVLLNCLIFFLYQSADDLKFFQAVQAYDQESYFDAEWPAFQKFLSENGETEELAEFRDHYNEEYYDEIVYALLVREDFYEYLQKHRNEYFDYWQADVWEAKRKLINKRIQSISSFQFGLIPSKLNPFTLISSQFMHGDTMHLLGNMFFLVVCGFAVEAAIGHLRFLLFYLASGVSGGLLFCVLDLSSTTPLIGASGAISGVMAMYVAAFRLKKIEFFYWFYIFVGYIRAPALLILPLYIGMELYDYFTNTGSNVAYLAHVGGFVGGAILIGVALWLNPDMFNREYIDEDQSVDPVQQQLAKVYAQMEKYRFKSALSTLNALIKEQGSSFELEKLRYHLLRTTKAAGFSDCILALLKMRHRNDRDLGFIDTLWNANPEHHAKLSDDEKLKLALNLSTPKHFATAERIFLALRATQCQAAALGILARKLSVCFEKRGDKTKMLEYARIADTLVVGAAR